MPPRRSNSSPPVNHLEIVEALRAKIIAGEFTPGARLPTLRTIQRKFGSSLATAQRAVHQLRTDGFLFSDGKLGIFVALKPPHTSRFALIFPVRRDRAQASRFWNSMMIGAGRMEQSGEAAFRLCFDVEDHRSTPDYHELIHRIDADGYAGLIFTSNPFQVSGSPLLTRPGIPRVAIASDDPSIGMPTVWTDMRVFYEMAIDELVKRGRRNLALLVPVQSDVRAIIGYAAGRGMKVHPQWVQHSYPYLPEISRQVTHLLMHRDQKLRPDALIIGEDHYVEAATEGLIATGARIPDDLDIVALCNFDSMPANPLGMTFLGFDIEALLRLCVQRVREMRRGQAAASGTLIFPQFDRDRRKTTSSA